MYQTIPNRYNIEKYNDKNTMFYKLYLRKSNEININYNVDKKLEINLKH